MPSARFNVGITIVIAVVFFIIGMLVSRFLLPGGLILSKGLPAALSSNILSLTAPVYSFSGQVQKIEGDTLVITQTIAAPPLAPAPGTDNNQTEKPKTISYNVKVSQSTNITRQAIVPVNAPVPASASGIIAAPAASLSINDIKVGDLVSASTDQDLRTTSGNSFNALSISLAPAQTALMGQVLKIEGNLLTVLGSPVGAALGMPVGPQEYRINLTDSTQISRRSGSRTSKINASDLKTGQQINITTTQGLNAGSGNDAALVEVIEIPNLAPAVAAPPLPSSSSAQPSSR